MRQFGSIMATVPSFWKAAGMLVVVQCSSRKPVAVSAMGDETVQNLFRMLERNMPPSWILGDISMMVSHSAWETKHDSMCPREEGNMQ
jgi:hypothetical protein